MAAAELHTGSRKKNCNVSCSSCITDLSRSPTRFWFSLATPPTRSTTWREKSSPCSRADKCTSSSRRLCVDASTRGFPFRLTNVVGDCFPCFGRCGKVTLISWKHSNIAHLAHRLGCGYVCSCCKSAVFGVFLDFSALAFDDKRLALAHTRCSLVAISIHPLSLSLDIQS